MTTKVELESVDDGTNVTESFKVTATVLVDAGYLAVQRGEEVDPDATLPEFKKGEVLAIDNANVSVRLVQKKTQPPTYLTESELIGTMERNGIGTDASIPTHIDNILKRNYVVLESGRRLVPTQLGIVLVQGYLRIDPDLVLPRVRSAIEEQCTLIAQGKKDKGEVVEHSLNNFKAKFEYFVMKINMMDELFGSSFTKLANAGMPFSRCGLTRRYLQFIDGPPKRLYNKFTEQVYSLPQGGQLKQYTGLQCSENCKFELVLYVVGSSPSRNYLFCPYCYNNPERQWGKMPSDPTGKNFCLECPLPDYHPVIKALTVCDDPESGGVFILDVASKPKWKFISTRSAFTVNLPKKIIKSVRVLKKVDEETGFHHVEVEFNPDAEVEGVTNNKHRGCLLTDPLLQSLLHAHEGSDRMKGTGRHGRGDRGGRGRGGRGRGGGRGRRGGSRRR